MKALTGFQHRCQESAQPHRGTDTSHPAQSARRWAAHSCKGKPGSGPGPAPGPVGSKATEQHPGQAGRARRQRRGGAATETGTSEHGQGDRDGFGESRRVAQTVERGVKRHGEHGCTEQHNRAGRGSGRQSGSRLGHHLPVAGAALGIEMLQVFALVVVELLEAQSIAIELGEQGINPRLHVAHRCKT